MRQQILWAKPPGVISSFGRPIATGAGVLKALRVDGKRIAIRIHNGDVEGSAVIQWDEPPSLATVEKVLRAHLNEPIIKIGELEIPEERT